MEPWEHNQTPCIPGRGIHDFNCDDFNRDCFNREPPPSGPSPENTLPTTTAISPWSSRDPGNDILAAFEDQRRQMLLLLCGRTEADGDLRYAPDKWSLKEVLGHLNDTERIMSYRALRISRGDADSHRRLRAGRLCPQWSVRPPSAG